MVAIPVEGNLQQKLAAAKAAQMGHLTVDEQIAFAKYAGLPFSPVCP